MNSDNLQIDPYVTQEAPDKLGSNCEHFQSPQEYASKDDIKSSIKFQLESAIGQKSGYNDKKR